MPANSFINFGTDVKIGESVQAARVGTSGWIELDDWSWDIEADHSNLKGTGAAVGKPNPGTLNFTHSFDLSSPVIMNKIVQGTFFATVKIDMLKQTGAEQPQQFFQIIMGNVFITKVSTKGGEDGAVTQDVDMVFKEVSVGYKAQNPDGTLDKAPLQFNWNIAQMNLAVDANATISFS